MELAPYRPSAPPAFRPGWMRRIPPRRRAPVLGQGAPMASVSGIVALAAVSGSAYLGFRAFSKEKGFVKFLGLGLGLFMGYAALESIVFLVEEISARYNNRPGPFEVNR